MKKLIKWVLTWHKKHAVTANVITEPGIEDAEQLLILRGVQLNRALMEEFPHTDLEYLARAIVAGAKKID